MLHKSFNRSSIRNFGLLSSFPMIKANFSGSSLSMKIIVEAQRYHHQKKYSNLLTQCNKRFFSQKKNGQTVTEQFKNQSKMFYQSQVENIIELQNSADWQKIVTMIREPLILDLYADWCQPCKKLTPKLEKRVKELQKQNKHVKLLKINIDKCPEIAQALQVKSVPTVYLLYMGQAIDGFQGDVPEQQLNKFFDTINKISDSSQRQKEAIMILQQGKQKIQEAKYEEAVQILQKLKQTNNREDLVAIKQIFLTQCFLSLNKHAKFKQSFAKTELYQSFYRQNADMHKFFQIMKNQAKKMEEFQKDDPQVRNIKDELEKYNDTNPQNQVKRLQLKFKLMEVFKNKQMMEQCLDTAMEIIKEDKNWEDKKTNKFVLQVFKDLGAQSLTVQKYRKILQRLLN